MGRSIQREAFALQTEGKQKMSKSKVVVEQEGQTLSVTLHPVVIINISDQYTRRKVAKKEKDPRVIGALIGTQDGRKLEIFNSFELPHDEIEGKIVVNIGFLSEQLEQMQKVVQFKDYEFLGWYSTSSEVTEADIEINKQFASFNESPLYLVLNAGSAATSRELPIDIYDTEVRIVDKTPTILFARMKYEVNTSEAERIAVDQIARVVSSSDTAT